MKEYQLAFDISTKTDYKNDETTLIITDSHVWATEFLRRESTNLYFLENQNFKFREYIIEAQKWTTADIKLIDSNTRKKFKRIIWVLSKIEDVSKLINQLVYLSTKETMLIIIAAGQLHRFLPVVRTANELMSQTALLILIAHKLRENGFLLQKRFGLHGVHSIIFNLGARVAKLFNFLDWHDRFLFSFRSVYQESGCLWALSTVVISHYRRS